MRATSRQITDLSRPIASPIPAYDNPCRNSTAITARSSLVNGRRARVPATPPATPPGTAAGTLPGNPPALFCRNDGSTSPDVRHHNEPVSHDTPTADAADCTDHPPPTSAKNSSRTPYGYLIGIHNTFHQALLRPLDPAPQREWRTPALVIRRFC
ncbi:hypothetical protein GCM10010522_41830 [Kribbella solani]